MSRETLAWLNQNTLIGFTSKRGNAWHYKQSEQGSEPNHYENEVPVEDVKRRLFHWKAVSGPLSTTVITPDGVLTVEDKERQVLVRPDTSAVLGVFKSGYQPHQYDEWLVDTVANLLDDDLKIGSAGLLKGGAVAWVSVEVPENLTTPEGVEFRPNLLAGTSFDGSLSTTFQRVVTNVVCDNTMSCALGESGQRIKVKHSKYSNFRLADARDALNIVHSIADDFAAEVATLCEQEVSNKQWEAFLDGLAPIPTEAGRGRTLAENKRDSLNRLWNNDNRVSPWKGTAYGVVQAVNTWTQHEQTVRGGNRVERNALAALNGDVVKADAEARSLIGKILASV